MPHTTQAIAEMVGGKLFGSGDLTISALAEIDHAKAGELTFIGSAQYAKKWAGSSASAALIGQDIELEPGEGKVLIKVDDADLAMATVLEAYAPPVPAPPKGVHPSALIAETATLGKNCRIGPNCVLKPGVQIGNDVTLHAGVTIYDDTTIGSGCELWTNAVVRERCIVGDRTVLHAGAVIGADGFGYRVDTSSGAPKVVKIPQIGVVIIGSDCEIGANTTIDRAKFDATVLGDHCKLDNLVQIGHNCKIGNMVLIAGCVGVAGSSTIGDGTLIGGKSMIKDHVHIGAGCQIAGGSAVINDMPDGEAWAGYPAGPIKTKFREEMAVRKLPDMMKKVSKVLKDL
ncbi:MAG: UDP-3-O-(3-hydroxymyristoyl)glucosamine N-acyltransferase [Phycisphaeraceae bacterium]|nr:UDP-3-O-(3-hydroxymyristoyl)glucosamine N-acyltransferase [Phycisphaeraceae bacterium]